MSFPTFVQTMSLLEARSEDLSETLGHCRSSTPQPNDRTGPVVCRQLLEPRRHPMHFSKMHRIRSTLSSGRSGNPCREGLGMQVCTCIPNGYCRSSAGTLTGGQYGSKGRGVETQDGCVARPVRPMETAEVFPCADVLDTTSFQLILGTPLATVASLL